MAHTVTVAAIKTTIGSAIDDVVTSTSGTPMVKELEAALGRAVQGLIADGTIAMSSRVVDS